MGMIININSPMSNIKKGDKMILDTNILLKTFFSKGLEKRDKYKENYQNYVHKCLSNKITLYTTEINIYEGFHVIDRINLDIYNNGKAESEKIKPKDFHKLEQEVKKSREDMRIFYKCVESAVNILPIGSLREIYTDDFFKSNNCFDIYDYALLKISENNGIKNILTDDSDFISDLSLIENINIFTQNSTILNKS